MKTDPPALHPGDRLAKALIRERADEARHIAEGILRAKDVLPASIAKRLEERARTLERIAEQWPRKISSSASVCRLTAANLIAEYMRGVREHWPVDQWRA